MKSSPNNRQSKTLSKQFYHYVRKTDKEQITPKFKLFARKFGPGYQSEPRTVKSQRKFINMFQNMIRSTPSNASRADLKIINDNLHLITVITFS